MAKKQISKIVKKVPSRKRKPSLIVSDDDIIEIDSLLKIINRVQVSREPATFVVREIDVYVVENILKDAELHYKKQPIRVEGKGICHQYELEPPPERDRADNFDFDDEFPDEILEDGQIFF
jgi:hypothetical protein